LGEIFKNLTLIYDKWNDAKNLNGVAGKIYTLDDRTVIIAPQGWN
jgi:hypothetical protein